MSYILFSLIFIGIGSFFFYKRKLKQNKIEEMLSSKNYSFDKIKSNFENPKLSNDNYEIYGDVTSSAALEAPFSKTNCVYYVVQILREEEVKEEFTNQLGEKAFRWMAKTSLIFEQEEFVDFSIGDQDGAVQIDLKGSELTPDLSYSSHEKTDGFSLPELIKENDKFIEALTKIKAEEDALNPSQTQVVGYIYKEYTLPVNNKLYALGSVKSQEGNIVMAKSSNQPFLISIKSPLDIYENLDQKIQVLFYAGAVCFVIAMILVFYGITGA